MYAFVDFYEREITSLEIVFERVEIFLCDLHREQAWHRWTNKIEDGFSHISDQVKTRLRRIAHSTTHSDCQSAVKDLMLWECFGLGKLKNWFLKIGCHILKDGAWHTVPMTLSCATRIMGLRG